MCGCLSHEPLLGTCPTTQACALTGNPPSDPWVLRLALNPLSRISQGYHYSSVHLETQNLDLGGGEKAENCT